MATLLDLSHINLNLQQNVQPANLASQPVQDYNGLDKAGLKASQEFLQAFAKARATTIDIQDEASASTNALDFQKDLSSKLDELQNLEGTKAQEAFDALPEKIAQSRELYADKNLNARQKFLFSKKTEDVENGALIRANSIQAYKAMQERLANMGIEESNKANEVANYASTKLFNTKVDEFEELVKSHTQERGLTGERAENEVRKGMTALMETIATGDIKNKRYGHARSILNQYIDKIDGVRRYALLDAITASEASDALEAEREAKANARAEFQLMIGSVDRFTKEGMKNQALECLDRAKRLGRYLGYSDLALQSYDVQTGGQLQNYSAKINQQALEQANKDFNLTFGAYKTYMKNGELNKAQETKKTLVELAETLGYSPLVIEAKELEGVRDFTDYIAMLDEKQKQANEKKYSTANKAYQDLASIGAGNSEEAQMALNDMARFAKLTGKKNYVLNTDIAKANYTDTQFTKKQYKETEAEVEKQNKEARAKVEKQIKDLRESAKIYADARKYDKASEANAKASELEKLLGKDPLSIDAQTTLLQQKAYEADGKRTMEIIKNKGLPQQEQNAMYETYYNQRDAESRKIVAENFRHEHGHDPKTPEEKAQFEAQVESDKKHFAISAVNNDNRRVLEDVSQKTRTQRDLFNQIESARDSNGRLLDYDSSGAKNLNDFKEMIFRNNPNIREQYYSMPEEDRKSFDDVWANRTERRDVGNTEQFNVYKSGNLLVEFANQDAIDTAVISYGLNRKQANELKVAWGHAMINKNIKTVEDYRTQQRLELSDGEKFSNLDPVEQTRIDRIIDQRNAEFVRYANEHNLNLGNIQDFMKAQIHVRSNFNFESSTPSADAMTAVYEESAHQRQTIDDGEADVRLKDFADSRKAENLSTPDKADFYEGLVKVDITTENGKQESHHSFVTTKTIQSLVEDMAHSIPERHYRRVDMANIQDLDDWYYKNYNGTIKTYNDIVDALKRYKKDNGRTWQTKYKDNSYQQTRLDKIIQSMEQQQR